MNAWENEFENAVKLWADREKLAKSMYMADASKASALMQLEASYEEIARRLATGVGDNAAVLQAAINSKGARGEVACHVILYSGDSDMESMLLQKMGEKDGNAHWNVESALRVCDVDKIKRFGHKALALQKPWIHDALSSVVAKNMLNELASYYQIDALISNPSTYTISMLGYVGDSSYTSALKTLMDDEDVSSYFRIECAKSLLLMGDDSGLDFYKFALSERLEDGTLAYLIGRYGNPEDVVPFLFNEAKEQSDDEDDVVGILKGLGFTGDIRAIDALKSFLSDESEEVRAAASTAISEITGEWNVDQYADEDELASFWDQWLSENIAKFDAATRYQRGVAFDLNSLASKMMNADRESRVITHEHLIVFSGLHVPYDEKRYYADQLTQVELWKNELATQNNAGAGGWVRHGRTL